MHRQACTAGFLANDKEPGAVRLPRHACPSAADMKHVLQSSN